MLKNESPAIRFKLGSDPELFLRRKGTAEFCSAIPVIPEGKLSPRPLDGRGNAVLHDNVLIEFNTTPAEDRSSFVQNIGAVLKNIDDVVGHKGAEIYLQASMDFPEEELQDPEARQFGCDPDFDAYELAPNVIAAEAAELPFRSAGGHLHIGYHEEDQQLKELLLDPYGKVRVVKSLDIFVGLVSVFLEKDETAAARRSLYGKAGAHRPKEYGVEYRACSAWWLASPSHTELVYDLSKAALQSCLNEENFMGLVELLGGEDNIRDVINNSRTKEARSLFDAHIAKLLPEQTKDAVLNLLTEESEFRKVWDLE